VPLSDIDIVFLMFVIGVLLSLKELVRASRIAVFGGARTPAVLDCERARSVPA
jgi:predicted Kef-type K+ transport protein